MLSIDRSNWKFGRKNINILMLSLCHKGMGIPILWTVLKDKRGNSSIKERMELLERFFRIIDPPGIIRLLGDREFIGEKWLDWLDSHYVHFVIRIRANQQVLYQGRREIAAKQLFHSENWRSLRKARPVSGYRCYLAGQKLKNGEYLILISNLPINRGRCYYQRRWEIELRFGALKTRGFNFEKTHISYPERIDTLMGLLALALAWAVKVGEMITQGGKLIPIKKHGRKAYSIFKKGLDEIRTNLLNNKPIDEFVQLLSCI